MNDNTETPSMENEVDMAELNRRAEEEMRSIKALDEMEFPLSVNRVEQRGGLSFPKEAEVGSFVAVRHIEEIVTRLGVYLGDMPTDEMVLGFDTRDDTLIIVGNVNPAIFVPEIGRVVRGYESWWGPIKSPDHLRQITDEDIQNVWYVKALKQFAVDEDENAEDDI